MDEPTVEVTAVGRASQVPDQVAIALGVEVTSPTVGQSLREASAVVERLVGFLDQIGVTGPRRQTTGLHVRPEWHLDERKPSGHTASYQLRLRVPDLDSAGRLVQNAEQHVGDALRVHGFELAVADPGPARERARAAAVVACRTQAEQLAQAAGVGIGGLQSLREEPAPSDGWVGQEQSYRASSAAGMPVEAGELETVVAVTAVWQLAST